MFAVKTLEKWSANWEELEGLYLIYLNCNLSIGACRWLRLFAIYMRPMLFLTPILVSGAGELNTTQQLNTNMAILFCTISLKPRYSKTDSLKLRINSSWTILVLLLNKVQTNDSPSTVTFSVSVWLSKTWSKAINGTRIKTLRAWLSGWRVKTQVKSLLKKERKKILSPAWLSGKVITSNLKASDLTPANVWTD